MAALMDLIVAGPENHILAVAVRHDGSGAAPDARALVGDGLPIFHPATGDTVVTVAAEQLRVETLDLRDDVLMEPYGFIIEDGLPEPSGAAHATPVVLNGTNITVNLLNNVPADGATVWVYIHGTQQPIIHQVEVASGNTATEPLLLPPGPYGILVLAPKVRAYAMTATL